MYVAVVADVPAVAYTAVYGVARPVALRGAVARLHAVVTVVALGADCGVENIWLFHYMIMLVPFYPTAQRKGG